MRASSSICGNHGADTVTNDHYNIRVLGSMVSRAPPEALHSLL